MRALQAAHLCGLAEFAREERVNKPKAWFLIAALLSTAAVLTSANVKGNAVSSSDDSSKYKKPSQEELKKKLSPEQYKVTQEEGTEAPFKNKYWDNHEDGIYVDIVTGEPLFSSKDKYDSGTGWPSFTQPIDKKHVVTKTDNSLFFESRTEVRSKSGDSHLGHVFKDGPGPTGERFCMNSASMRFVPVAKLKEEGYGEYLPLFAGSAAAAGSSPSPKTPSKKEVAILAGGCFWGVEELIRSLPGVLETVVGYTGGITDNPTYNDVKKGNTGHAEAIRIEFDPSKISYEQLLEKFFKLHDPTTLNRQGNDIGTQYRSSIFYLSDEQKATAEKVKKRVDESGKWKKPVVTEIVKATKFYPAEEYHQDYLKKNPGGYTCHYWRD